MARILIVDDEKCNIGILSLVVSNMGHEPIKAYSGKHAINIVTTKQPSLVLLDFMMPGINGVETLRHIRDLPSGKSLPIFIITASQDQSVEERVRSIGATGFLKKPFDLNTLKGLIEEHCNKGPDNTFTKL
ncbi:MAG: response regulator [Anaerolineales bacterium]